MVRNVTNPFDIVKHLNRKTELEFDIQDYKPWTINRAMSNRLDTLFFAEIMNESPHLSPQMQHDFYFYGLSKMDRYGEWQKSLAINSHVEMIIKKYQVNQAVAESYYKLMDSDALKQLEESMVTGGRNGGRN